MQKVIRSWPAIHDERIIEKEKNAFNHFFRFNERTPEKEAIIRGSTAPDYKQETPVEPMNFEVQNGDPSVVVPKEKPKKQSKPNTKKSTIRKE